ncbi:uncharacterized protein LOC108871601 [Brassica rapa]|uniref:uncharacterized protein LOC108871601 n=1 Tax=Brassica campestris TaxID=3711 RepID=UPI0008731506|nr:uncharacterized protein LOC108871601 [Brassica rapa]
MKEIGNGRHTSFWYDNWSNLGVMSDLLGPRGVIDLGIRREATVEEVLLNERRRRRHRSAILIEIEKELEQIKEKQRYEVKDIDLWKRESGFKPNFSTHETWKLTRASGIQCDWGRCTWFSQATPKFAFLTWLAMRDRLATMDRLWEHLMRGILRSTYSVKWDELIRLLTDSGMDKKKRFCFRYTFQVTLYSLWRERNRRRHGEQAMPARVLSKLTDKAVRNKLSLTQLKGVKGEKHARHTKMLEDIVAWAAEHPEPSTLMLVMSDISQDFLDVVDLLTTKKNYRFIEVLPHPPPPPPRPLVLILLTNNSSD